MKLAIQKEQDAFEKRVAASPETVKKFTALGIEVCVETGAGMASAVTDEMYQKAGAKIVTKHADIFKNSDLVLCVSPPLAADVAVMKKTASLVAILSPYQNDNILTACQKSGINAFAMEMVPRISRAQSMDVLSSQSNLAGYKAVLDAAAEFTSAFPLMMTAAGTVPPAKVFVMGAGVAGLQAIATARRLGAIVSATDVRMAAKEQVQSLGADFVMVEDDETQAAETAGGYAKEMSEDYQKKQQNLVEETIQKQDIVITTALIPGRPAPKLITKKMVESMKPGSVIVDLAVEMGGNCELSVAGKVIDHRGVKIVGHRNVPSRVATDASSLYARNVFNFVKLMWAEDTQKIKIDRADEIIAGTLLVSGGKRVHPNFVGSDKTSNKKTAAPKKNTVKKTVKKAVKKTPVKKKATSKKTSTPQKKS